MDNIVEIIFKATITALREGTDAAKAQVKEAMDSIKSSTDGVTSSTSKATESAKTAFKETGASAKQAAQSVKDYGESFKDIASMSALLDGNTKSMADLAAQSDAVERLWKSGRLAGSEYAEAVEAIEAAEVGQNVAAAAAAVQLEKAGKGVKEFGAINGGVAREIGVLFGEGVRGNYTRLEGSAITLANRTGLLELAFSGMGIAVLSAVAVIAVVAKAFLQAEERTNAFEKAIAMTGDSIGMTSSQMIEASNNIATFTGDSSGADEIITRLGTSGKMSGQLLIDAARGAANAMILTGESAQQAAKEIESLAGNPTEAVVKLNEKYHFLTVELYDQIDALQRSGHEYEAAELAAKAFADNTSERVQHLYEQMGYFERALSDMKTGWSAIDHALQKTLDPTKLQQSVDATHAWFEMQERLNGAIKAGVTGYALDNMKRLTQAAKDHAIALRDEVRGEQKVAEAAANKIKLTDATLADVAAQNKLNDSLRDGDTLTRKLNEEKERVKNIHENDPGNQSIKGLEFDDSGLVKANQAWLDIVAKINKEYGEVDHSASDAKSAAREAAREAKAAAQAEMNGLYEKRSLTESNSKERMQLDEQIVAKAKQLYGGDTSQYRTAIAQMLTDKRAAANQEVQLEIGKLANDKQIAVMKQDALLQQYQFEYQQGLITNEELLALDKRVIAEKLALEKQFITAKAALQRGVGNGAAAKTTKSGIGVAEQRSMVQLQTAELTYQKNSLKQWQRHAQQITGAMGGAIKGMIFQGQTLKQATTSLLGNMLSSFIDFAMQKLAMHIAGESAQTLATVAGNEARVASDGVAAVQSNAITADTAVKSILAKAWSVMAGVYDAIASIPYVGPFLAPVLAVAAGATVVGFASHVASAEGGWDRVPHDGAKAILHKDEMVLPKDLADGVRNMAQGGGQQQQKAVHFHVSALDGKSVKQFFRKHGPMIRQSLGQGAGNFRLEG